MLDFGTTKVTRDEVRDEKTQHKILKRVQKGKQRQDGFRHVINNVGRGRNTSLKQLKLIDESSNRTKTHNDRHVM